MSGSPAIVWFRNDLRLSDNPALTAAASQKIIALYILDDETPGPWAMGSASRWWLHRSLESLGRRLPLLLRRGPADKVIANLLRETNAASVHFMRSYEPWSAALESRINAVCKGHDAEARRYGSYLLHEPEAIQTAAGQPFKVYTPFSRACFSTGEPRPPKPSPKLNFSSGKLSGDELDDWKLLPKRPNWARGFEELWQPGEEGAQERLRSFIDERLSRYDKGRDRPDEEATSHLSPHLHFGEVSPAQCWHAVRGMQHRAASLDTSAEKFLKELLWREFSCHLLHHWPALPDKPFRPEFENFPWADDQVGLKAWQNGQTGYPIVDAGMRELWATGIMHNRVRMIAASFLIKDLLIPWTEGENWFWDTLVDADLASNAANWQWVAGSGADAAPYFRIFNPILQGEKFDPQGAYVRQWVPELANLPGQFIHRPWEAPHAVLSAAGLALGQNYPHPVVDHAKARNRALAALRTLK